MKTWRTTTTAIMPRISKRARALQGINMGVKNSTYAYVLSPLAGQLEDEVGEETLRWWYGLLLPLTAGYLPSLDSLKVPICDYPATTPPPPMLFICMKNSLSEWLMLVLEPLYWVSIDGFTWKDLLELSTPREKSSKFSVHIVNERCGYSTYAACVHGRWTILEMGR